MSVDAGKVFLVGAGPGDPGLITIKGRQCIEKADVLVYDRLASPRLLAYASSGAELIYVGKLPDRHTMRQKEINQLLVNKARQGKIVTRLKGGDPFVFGRGGEEAIELADNGIPFEVIPGITSAVSVPAYAGIPVTHRGIASSFAVITGHEDPEKEESEIDWAKLAGAAGTLVFLMGVANLTKITSRLIKHGLSPATPIALVRWGTRPEQETVTGTLSNIAAKVKEAGLSSPAVTVVGETVGLRDKIAWFEKKPLFGCRILVTRARHQAGTLSQRIEELGGEAVEFPTIDICPPRDWRPLDEAIKTINCYKWIVFTSVNGVESFFTRVKNLKYDIRSLAGCKLAAIGPQTAAALEKMGLQVDFCPSEFKAEAVLAGLKDLAAPGERVLIPRAEIAREVLPVGLEQHGIEVNNIPVYRTCRSNEDAGRLRKMLLEGEINVVTFTSSSTVKNFAELIGAEGEKLKKLLGHTVIACIGPITSRTARSYGLKVNIEAPQYTIPGLVQAIVNYFRMKI